MEYVIDQLIEQVCEEIATKDVLDQTHELKHFDWSRVPDNLLRKSSVSTVML